MRDYDDEFKDKQTKYVYSFDFDVMHPYMFKTFEPFFQGDTVLELGSFKGDFTKLLEKRFRNIICIEASEEAALEASLKTNAYIIPNTFEECALDHQYDNVVLTHVLEHLDDPIAVLKKINDKWLSSIGRLFIVVPNAMAASRQIATKMGVLSHCSVVTEAEKEHGHQITYSFDTLERDAKAAGLKIVYRSGILFKPLANFQWDQMMAAGLISKEYIEGCYQLGMVYPELCASIFMLCERG